MKHLKFWHFVIEEINGEHEYNHDHLVMAFTLKQAEKIARRTMREWYAGKPEKLGEGLSDGYDFGDVIVRAHPLREVSIQEYMTYKLGVELLMGDIKINKIEVLEELVKLQRISDRINDKEIKEELIAAGLETLEVLELYIGESENDQEKAAFHRLYNAMKAAEQVWIGGGNKTTAEVKKDKGD